MTLQPYVLGSGMSGQSMAKALSIIALIDPEMKLAPAIQLKRGQKLAELSKNNPLLMIANPHGLHTSAILEAIDAGFKHIITDKPVCTNKEDLAKLKSVKHDIAVCHGYRQQWGPQTIKKMIDAGEFGEIISVEGRYWQSSHAVAALNGGGASKEWKNDPKLHGPYDAFVDLGAHYADLMFFFAGAAPTTAIGWVSHINAPAAHRDSHAWMEFHFPKFRARGSISKAVHGRGNVFEVTVIGAKQAVSWSFERADQIEIAKGATTTTLQRTGAKHGSQTAPFHAMGWIEGYIEIIHNYLKHARGDQTVTYPNLQDGVRVMETLLNCEMR